MQNSLTLEFTIVVLRHSGKCRKSLNLYFPLFCSRMSLFVVSLKPGCCCFCGRGWILPESIYLEGGTAECLASLYADVVETPHQSPTLPADNANLGLLKHSYVFVDVFVHSCTHGCCTAIMERLSVAFRTPIMLKQWLRCHAKLLKVKVRLFFKRGQPYTSNHCLFAGWFVSVGLLFFTRGSPTD